MAYLLLLPPIAWLAMKFSPYALDGDGMAYMDVADLIRTHHWAGVVNGYWHPLYPALLSVAQRVFHTTRCNELHAYYILNYLIFLASVGAMLAFVSALVKLRLRLSARPESDAGDTLLFGTCRMLLNKEALQLLGVALLVIATGRELSMATIRPDALLQALMLAAFAMLLQSFASESLIYAPAMGFFFGLAYLTKSFAFLIALITYCADDALPGLDPEAQAGARDRRWRAGLPCLRCHRRPVHRRSSPSRNIASTSVTPAR